MLFSLRGRRLSAFGVHLAASAALIGVTLSVLWLGWYFAPGWELRDADIIVGYLLMVDLGLGPVATFVVSDPKKPLKEWRRDLAVVFVVQLTALALAIHTLWAGRPIFYVFAIDRMELVAAHELDRAEVERAASSGSTFAKIGLSRARFAALVLPEAGSSRSNLMWRELSGEVRSAELVGYYRPLGERKRQFAAASDRTRHALLKHPKHAELMQSFLRKLGRDGANTYVLQLFSRSQTWLMFFDADTLDYVGCTNVDA